MTNLEAQQIEAHAVLTSAFYRVTRRDKDAGMLILDARAKVAAEMDANCLVLAVTLSNKMDYFARVA